MADNANLIFEDYLGRHIQEYYNSVQKKFRATLFKHRISTGIAIVLFLAFLTPFIYPEYLIFLKTEKATSIRILFFASIEMPPPPFSTLYEWLNLCILIGWWIVLYKLLRLTDRVLNKGSLDSDVLKFCYVYTAYLELKNYLTNNQEEHLDHSINYLDYYFQHEEFFKDEVVKKIDDLALQHHWFKLDFYSMFLAGGIQKLRSKVYTGILLEKDLSSHLHNLQLFSTYLYCRIEKEDIEETIKPVGDEEFALPLKDYGSLQLRDYAQSVDYIPDYTPEEEQPSIPFYKQMLNSLTTTCNKILYHPNLFISFVVWTLLAYVMLLTLLLFTLWIFNINKDSEIVSGFYAAVPAAAAFLSGIAIQRNNRSRQQQ